MCRFAPSKALKLPSQDVIQRLAAQLTVFETQFTEPGYIFFLMDKTNLIFDFQQGRPYIGPDINAP